MHYKTPRILTAALVLVTLSGTFLSAQADSPAPVIMEYGQLKDAIVKKGERLIREIDLRINPKARNRSCDRQILRSREKATADAQELFAVVALLPDRHYKTITPGLVCSLEPTRQPVTNAKRRYLTLVRTIATLVRKERSCRAKYGLSYPPDYKDLNEVNTSLASIPKKITVCS
jgi:hypothetical protein